MLAFISTFWLLASLYMLALTHFVFAKDSKKSQNLFTKLKVTFNDLLGKTSYYEKFVSLLC